MINVQVNEGAMHDASAFYGLMNFISDHDLDAQSICAVTDRGFDSSTAFSQMLSKGMHFVCGSIRRQNSLYERSIKEKYELLTQCQTLRPEIDRHVTTIKVDHFPYVELGHTFSKSIYLHLYRDDYLESDRRRQLQREVLRALDVCKRNLPERHDPQVARFIKKYLTFNPKDKSWRINQTALMDTVKTLGMFGIWTDILNDPVECWNVYRQRNMVELGFNVFKHRLGGSRLYATQSTYLGNILILSLAQSIYMTMYHRLSRSELKGYTSLSGLMNELDTELIVNYRRNDWSVKMNTTRAVEIFDAFGIKIPKRIR